jgi:hypothetical protein
LDRGVFVLSTDASWSNCDDLRSQGGYFVALADETFLNGKAVPLSPLRWKSYKLERHCQSTLGSELMSLSRGIAEGEWIRSLFGEALNPDYQLKEDKRFREKIGMVCLIDNKPIYDHQIGDGIVVKNKREAIDMLIVRRDFRENNMKLSWIETNNMLADVLTKENAPVALLLFVLRGGGYSLKSFQTSERGVMNCLSSAVNNGGDNQHDRSKFEPKPPWVEKIVNVCAPLGTFVVS